jgi:hypothetical protein
MKKPRLLKKTRINVSYITACHIYFLLMFNQIYNNNYIKQWIELFIHD